MLATSLPLSHPSRLAAASSVVVPLDEGHGDHLGWVLGVVVGGGDRGGTVNGLVSACTECRNQVLLLCWCPLKN